MPVRVIALFVALGCAGSADAQSVSFSAPGLGYVFDKAAGSLRPIRGMAGAATVGDALALPSPISGAVISSRLGYAIARADAHPTLLLIRNLGGETGSSELDGIPRAADLISLSVSGRHAAIFSAEEGSVRVISGLPDAPVVAGTHDVTGARLTAIAVNDSGVLVGAFAHENTGDIPPAGVLRVHSPEAGAWRDLAPTARIRSITFAPDGLDVIVVDDAAASVSLIRNVASEPNLSLVMSTTEGGAALVAARFMSGTRVLIATQSGVVTVNLADNSRSESICGCKPTGIDELDNTAFRLTELSEKPLWILHDSSEGTQLLFVPPPPVSGSGEDRTR